MSHPSPIDPTTPVIVGVGQINRRQPDDRDAVELMADACRLALADAGSTGLEAATDLVAVLDGLWSWTDPGRLVAQRIGATGARTLLTTFGGQTPQALTGALAARIERGDIGAAIVCGGEINHTRRRARRAGRTLPRTPEPAGREPTERFGDRLDMGSEHERSRGLIDPLTTYAVIESILMAKSPGGPDRHLEELGRLWAGFASVAAENPHAADRRGPDPDEIIEVTPSNRMVSWPYPKSMCANNDVDMAAALVICSAEVASSATVPRDRWVFPWAATEADDTHLFSARAALDESPALADAGRAVLDTTGLGIDEIDHLELYSCFPSIVEMTVEALGIDPDRQLTMTGGLGFAGAAMNTATLHGICAMSEGLRREPGLGLVHGNGGNATHHAFGIYSSDPPATPFIRLERRPELATRKVAPSDATGPVEVEGSTVRFDRDGPRHAVVSCITPAGARAWALTDTSDTMEWLRCERVGCGGGRLGAEPRSGVVEAQAAAGSRVTLWPRASSWATSRRWRVLLFRRRSK